MTDAELAELIRETAGQLEKLSGEAGKPLTKEEKNRKAVLQLKSEALERIKEAKQKGSLRQEIKAGIDYALLEKYGEKHPFLMNFIKSQTGWYGF